MKKINSLTTHNLFDGSDVDLYSLNFKIYVENLGIEFKVSEFSDERFRKESLKEYIDEEQFNQIIEHKNFNSSNFPKDNLTYKSENDLPIDYIIKEGYLFLFEIGEYQYTRFKLNINSIWKLDDSIPRIQK